MSIRRKDLQPRQREPLGMELLTSFPLPPLESRSTSKVAFHNSGLTSTSSDYGSDSSRLPANVADTEPIKTAAVPSKQHCAQDSQPAGTSVPVSVPAPVPPPKHSAELQLVLDHPFKIYAPGETMTGYIIGWSAPEEQVHIIMVGQTKTTIQDPKIILTDNAPLTLQVTPVERDSQTSVPRFELRIPHLCSVSLPELNQFTQGHTAPRGYWTATWPCQIPFEHESGHPLPPSFHVDSRSIIKLTTVHLSASVAYALIAVRSTCKPGSTEPVPNASFHLPIALTTLRLPISKVDILKNEKHLTTASLSIQTAALTKERKLRLREQLYDAFNSAAPTFYFKAQATTPRLSVPGANVQLNLKMEVLPPPPGKLYSFPIPDISVTSIRFTVRSYTGIRVLASALGSSQPPANHPGPATRWETLKLVEFRQTQTPAVMIFTPQEGDFGNQVFTAAFMLPKSLSPCFKTYNAWRGYRLECTVSLSVAGKAEHFEIANDLDVVAGGDGRVELARVSEDESSVIRQVAEGIVRKGAGQ